VSSWRRPNDAQLAAFEAFVAAHASSLGRLSTALAPSPADAQDLLQDTLVLVLERWEKVCRAEDPYFYVRRMMVNKSTSTWRRRRHELHEASAESELSLRSSRGTAPGGVALLWKDAAQSRISSEDSFIARESHEVLVKSIQQLPQRQRTVLVLRYLEEMTVSEVAALMGISPVTVRSATLRALRSLRGLVSSEATL